MNTRSQNQLRRLISIAIAFTLLSFSILPNVQAAAGDLDPTFAAPNGFATLSQSEFNELAIQPGDGKIVAIGASAESNLAPTDLIVARFNTDGTLDSGFGSAGVATALSQNPLHGLALALQNDGKIVAVGLDLSGSGDFFITRFDSSGNVDTAFAQNGSRTIDFGGLDIPFSVAIGPNNTIVVSGLAQSSNIGLVRLDSQGNFDPTFGSGGKVVSESGQVPHLAVLGDGRILVGAVVGPGLASDFALLRYNSNGTLDTSFGGGDGIATADFNAQDTFESMAVQPDGRIVLAGFTVVDPATDKRVEALARFDANGNLDSSFDGDGGVTGFSPLLLVRDVAIQPDGRIVTTGDANLPSGHTGVLVSRHNADGSADNSFGIGGVVRTDFGANTLGAGAAIQNDGKILIAGLFTDGGPANKVALLARYDGGPLLSIFDVCAQSGSFKFQFNSMTGAYEFRDCAKGTVLTGTGVISVSSCKTYLNTASSTKGAARTVAVTVNNCTKVASVQLKNGSTTYGFTDTDITQGSCMCP